MSLFADIQDILADQGVGTVSLVNYLRLYNEPWSLAHINMPSFILDKDKQCIPKSDATE